MPDNSRLWEACGECLRVLWGYQSSWHEVLLEVRRGARTGEPGGSNPLMRDARNNKAWNHPRSQGSLVRRNRAGRAPPSQRAARS
jgi:hypothetical protein